jgi:hypothetical protein
MYFWLQYRNQLHHRGYKAPQQLHLCLPLNLCLSDRYVKPHQNFMKKKQTNKLRVRKSTLTHLSHAEARAIQGGYTGDERCADSGLPNNSCQICPVPPVEQ